MMGFLVAVAIVTGVGFLFGLGFALAFVLVIRKFT